MEESDSDHDDIYFKNPMDITNQNNATQKNVNSISEDKQQSSLDTYKNYYQNSKDKSQTNSLQKNMENISLNNPTISSIKKVTNGITSSSFINTIKNYKEKIKEQEIPYPNGGGIPLLKIKDENFFESMEHIGNYLKDLDKFDDTKFNKCTIYQKIIFVKFVKKIYVKIVIKKIKRIVHLIIIIELSC